MKSIPFLSFFFLGGCMVGPDYQAPSLCVAESWQTQEKNLFDSPIEQKWWEGFQDPRLTAYIDLIAKDNRQMRHAEARLLQARSFYQVSASSLFPQIFMDLNGTKTYFSKNGALFTVQEAQGSSSSFNLQTPQLQNLFNASFDASWELDLFGKTRRSMQAARAGYESVWEERNDLLVSLFAETARNYLHLRSLQKQADLLQKKIQLFQEQKEIVEESLLYGYVNQIDLESLEAQILSTQAELPPLYAQIYRAIFALSVLIGKPPETLVETLWTPSPLPDPPQQVTVGLRSDLLRRRADVRFAERKLAQATANVGVAVASFFPTFELLGSGGLQSLTLPSLFEWASKTWAYGADVNTPIFEGGKLLGTLQMKRAEEAMAVAQYQQVVLQALQQAESGLKKYEQLTQSTKDLSLSTLHSSYVSSLTLERHLKGLVNRIDLIEAQKRLIVSQELQLQGQTSQLLALVALYKELGGGWEPFSNFPESKE